MLRLHTGGQFHSAACEGLLECLCQTPASKVGTTEVSEVSDLSKQLPFMWVFSLSWGKRKGAHWCQGLLGHESVGFKVCHEPNGHLTS